MWLHRPRRRNRPQLRKAGYMLRRIIIIITLAAAVPTLSYGKGQQEDPLSRADKLIEERRFNEALTILTALARESPRSFDNAQKRVRKILFFREQFNEVFRELFDEMEKDPPDPERIVALGRQLNELDPQRYAEAQSIIGSSMGLAMSRTSQQQLDRILRQGQEQTNRGAYGEALRTYSGGFSIYQDEFFTGKYGAAMENRTRQAITTLTGSINAVTAAGNALVEAVNALEALSGQGIEPQNLTAYRNAYNRVGAEMDRFTALRNTYANADAAFREDLIRLRQNFPQDEDQNFLAFAILILEGRGNQKGMLGVFDSIWNSAVPRARALLDTKSRTVFTATVNDAAANEYGRIGTRSDTLAGYASFPVNLEVRWGQYNTAPQRVTLFNEPVPSGEAGNYLKFRSLERTAPYWRTLGQLGNRFTAVLNQTTLAGGRVSPEEQGTVTALRQILTDAENLLGTIQREGAEYRAQETRYPNSGSLTYIDGVSAAVTDLINAATGMIENSSVQRYIIANRAIESRIRAREEELSRGEEFLRGTQKGDYLAKYPTQAAEQLSGMETAIEADRQAMEALLNQYNREPAAIAGNSQIRNLREEARALQSRMERVRAQGRTSVATARTQSTDAANLRREGDRLFAEAQTALARNDFDTAENRMNRASDAYFQSLEREEDEETYNKRNTAIPELGRRIAIAKDADNQRRITELTAQIEESFFRGDFDQAQQRVTQAQNLWKQTQPGESVILAEWALRIQNALRSGRNIPPTAPLYAEMSQLLSDARKNYEEGKTQWESSRPQDPARAEATRKLDTARQNLQKVRLVYPMNADAGILELLIAQVTDTRFTETLDSRIQTAVNRTKTGSIANKNEGLNDLLNLSIAFRNHTNWPPIIRQAEIDTGRRPPDPTPQEIEEARQIVNSARPVINSGNADQIRAAQSELARAIKLDPNNQEAKIVYDLATRRIAIVELVLDYEAERLFIQASQALVQDDAIRARRLIQEILNRNSNYQYVSKVALLIQRVQSR